MGGPYVAPNRRFRIGEYEFATYTQEGHPQRFLWEASAKGRGVGGHKTPISAFFALRQWMKTPVTPTED